MNPIVLDQIVRQQEEIESLRQQLEASQKREVILRDELFAVLVQDMSRDSAIAKIEALAATESKP